MFGDYNDRSARRRPPRPACQGTKFGDCATILYPRRQRVNWRALPGGHFPDVTPIACSRHNCKTAFQLNWALSRFWHPPVDDCDWLAELQKATEAYSVRILKHDLLSPV